MADEPTAEQLDIARGVGRKLGRNLPASGVMNAEDVEQLAIEAMLELLSKGETSDNPRYFGGAIRNRTIDALRREGVLTRVQSDGEADEYERRERVTFDGLEPRQREILTQSFEEDLAPREIAKREGSSATSVRSMKARALRILRGKLSERELEVLVSAANGLTITETAAKLGIEIDTVKVHRKTAMSILSARGMTNAIAIAFQRGILY